MTPIDFGILAAYVAGVLALGVVVSRRIVSFRDYFVAGGRMTTPLLVCTLVSTYYGLDVLFGGSEVSYMDGVVAWFFYARPYYLAILLTAVLVARRLKAEAGSLSLPDVAARHYGRGTQAVIAAASFVYSIPLLALMGMGVLFDVMLGLPFAMGVALGAVVSLVYTLFGGLLADALTDTVQFTLMCVTLGIAAVLALGPLGGVDGLRAALPASYFEPLGTYPPYMLVVFSLAALSVFVEPAFYQRIFAAESHRSILVALGIGVVLWAAFDWITTLLGMAAAAYGIQVEPRYALITLTLDVLPVGLAGLFAAGVVATAMSTIDSYLLIAGGNLAWDLYRPLMRPDLSDADALRLTRWGVVVAGAVSVLLALFFRSMASAWIFMSTMLVATAFVPIMAALYLPARPRPAAGLAASLTGVAVATGWVVAINLLGSVDPEWGTSIWRVRVGGTSVDLWQEYALLLALPASAVAFLLGQRLGRSSAPPGGAPFGTFTGEKVRS